MLNEKKPIFRREVSKGLLMAGVGYFAGLVRIESSGQESEAERTLAQIKNGIFANLGIEVIALSTPKDRKPVAEQDFFNRPHFHRAVVLVTDIKHINGSQTSLSLQTNVPSTSYISEPIIVPPSNFTIILPDGLNVAIAPAEEPTNTAAIELVEIGPLFVFGSDGIAEILKNEMGKLPPVMVPVIARRNPRSELELVAELDFNSPGFQSKLADIFITFANLLY